MKHRVPTIKQKIKMYNYVLGLLNESLKNDLNCCICDSLYTAQVELKYVKENMYGALDARWSRSNGMPYLYHTENRVWDCIQSNFPELLERKPVGVTIGWFWWEFKTLEGVKKRIEVIEDILNELQAELNKS